MGIPPFRGGIVYEEMSCQRHGGSTTAEFREGAVTIVRETGKPIAEVARDLGIGAGTLGNWVKKDRLARGEESDGPGSMRGLCARLERENAELRMERDVLKRSVVLWVKEAERHEAFLDRAVVKGHRLRARRSGLGEAEGSLIPGTRGRAEAALTTPGRASTVRWSGSGKQDGKVYVRNQRLNAPQVDPPART